MRFYVGDAERLPYAHASFEVVSSAQGVVFGDGGAPLHAELRREPASG